MKRAFATLIPLCIIGFVGFWISTLFLGTSSVTSMDSISVIDDSNSVGGWSKSYTVKHEEFTAEIAANSNLSIELSDVSAVVEPSDNNKIGVYVRNTSSRAVNVALSRDQSTNTSIKISTGVSFGLFNINIPDIFGLFGGNLMERQVIIKVPRKTFDSLKISQGSGKATVSGINARENSIDLGSGELDFSRAMTGKTNSFNINMGSGKATFTGIQTSLYHINIGSGECKIANLTGSGVIEIGSGSVDISYDQSPTGKLDMGSGYAKISVPTSADTKFIFNIGSGSVEVCANTQIQRYNKTGEYTMGSKGFYNFNINLGSGKIDIGYKGFTPGVVSSQTD